VKSAVKVFEFAFLRSFFTPGIRDLADDGGGWT
jgi:hypothetical protein